MRFQYSLLVVGMLWLACPSTARAQAFFGRGVSAFTPEIDVVNSGVVNDLSATVSPDRKYVTLGMRPQQSQLLALNNFAFQRPGGAIAGGFVGGAVFAEPFVGSGSFGTINPPALLADGAGPRILQQRGMTRIVLK